MKHQVLTAVSMAALIGLATGSALAQGTVAQSCGKQWTIADANNDLTLTPEEAEASRDLEFSRLDQDGDGEISEEEWALCNDMSIVGEALSGAGDDAAEASTEATSSQAQSDAAEASMERPMIDGLTLPDVGAGDLSREELVESMKEKYAAASQAARQEAREPAMEETQARFSGAWFRLHDANNDGKVTPEELAEADLEGASKRAFDRVDENNDGVISKSEYGKWLTTRYEAAQQQARGGLPVSVWHYYVLVD